MTALKPKLAFERTGFLPPGIHECTLDDLRLLVLTNAYRETMWVRLVSFLSFAMLRPHFSYVYLAGGFLSTKAKPADIDVILQPNHPFGRATFSALERFFKAGLNDIRDRYSIDLHFWMDGAPGSLADYRVFFQYDRAKPDEHLCGTSRGIAKISLRGASIRRQLKKLLHGLNEEIEPAKRFAKASSLRLLKGRRAPKEPKRTSFVDSPHFVLNENGA